MKTFLKAYFTKKTLYIWLSVIVINLILEAIHKVTGWYTDFHIIIMTIILVSILAFMFPNIFLDIKENIDSE